MKTKYILIADAMFLGVAGTVQIIQEILGHFAERGLYAEHFANSPYTIGFFEAHSLAVLFAASFILNINNSNRRFWHGIAVAIHLVLGGANLIFWQSFVAFDFVTQGIVATTLHGIFIILNLYALKKEQI